ncbi:type I glyceraldehyde-3-phosphate dehydrogenase [Candidatus Pacearchaeota archaeon]|nr:type I glyceraldehyde-3-phosphate dehydrogenase [Candidatus Pacearchaeota archaeon]
MNIAINGFGRIGKQFFLACMEQKVSWNFVINDIASLDYLAYSLKYDTVHPTPQESVKHDGKYLYFGKKKMRVYTEMDPLKLPWKDEKIDVVVDCTGMFTEREGAMKHIQAGAKKVLISAPAKGHDCTLVCGVNNSMLKKDNRIISAGSCTTNSVSPLVSILHNAFEVISASFITTHAYTATQRLVDSADKKDMRRGRAAAENIVPSTSGASISVVESIPELKGKLTGYALRVPVADGSLSSVFAHVRTNTTAQEINALFKKQAEKMKGILLYNEDEIVSSDIIHNPSSCIFDSTLTSVTGNLVSVAGWYDNEWGYSNRLVDVVKLL